MDWTVVAARLDRGMTELAEEFTMWRPDLPCQVRRHEPAARSPLAIELSAEVAEPWRGVTALHLTVAFETASGRLTAYADIRLDRADEVVPGRTATMPSDADAVSWAQDEVDQALTFLRSQVPAVRRWTEPSMGLKPLPVRPVVRQRVVDLIAGRRSPESVADWAMHYTTYDEEYEVTDWVVWRALGSLSGADMLIAAEGTYLFGEIDFRNWLAELDAGVAD